MPPGRERERQPGGVDHLAGRLPTEQPPLEQVRLAATPCRGHDRRAADRPLVLEQALQDVDRRPERGHGRAVLHLAVPTAVGELLSQEALDERRHVHPEVRAGGHDVAVDARLDLAVEEAVVGPWVLPGRAVAPGDVLADQADGPLGLLAGRIEPEPPQQLQGMEGVREVARPRLAVPQAVRSPAGRGAGRPSPRWRSWTARRRRRPPARASGRASPASGSTDPRRAASR